MKLIRAKNVNEAFVDGLWWLRVAGVKAESRNGPVIRAPGPVVTEYLCPIERVLFNELRDCNPFFHIFESVWMLAGCDRAAPLTKYVRRMADYAEDDGFIHGAYGYRWRTHFEWDQLASIVTMLKKDPTTRRAVLAMWDAHVDLNADKRDLPCNTHCYFGVDENGRLDMTICNRSNDIIWGAYGANAVHFSILQEFIANAAGLPVGKMVQFSNNFHIYQSVPHFDMYMSKYFHSEDDPYYSLRTKPFWGITDPYNWKVFLSECGRVVEKQYNVRSPWLKDVVIPMIKLWDTRDLKILDSMADCDWKVAAKEWLDRRAKNESE